MAGLPEQRRLLIAGNPCDRDLAAELRGRSEAAGGGKRLGKGGGVDLNQVAMDKFRPLMRPFYYEADKYDTYLEQLDVSYPQLERPA